MCFGSMRLNMGAFFSMSGMIINLSREMTALGGRALNTPHTEQTSGNRRPEALARAHRIRLPRTKMCSRLEALPSCSDTCVSWLCEPHLTKRA